MVVNCMCCGKVFNYTSGAKVCKKCDVNIFLYIKECLENNKSTSAYDISRDIKIPLKIVKDYIMDDRLVALRGDVKLCKNCFDIVLEGDLCESCFNKISLKNSLANSIIPKSDEKVKVKFHTKDLIQKKR